MAACRFMIVDDDPTMREFLRVMIEDMSESFEVVAEASNGYEAVCRAEEVNPDVIIMDIRMPVMDGVEATRCIKQDLGLRAILITATSFGWRDIEDLAYEAGASFHVRKPFKNEEIKHTLRQAVQSLALSPVVGA